MEVCGGSLFHLQSVVLPPLVVAFVRQVSLPNRALELTQVEPSLVVLREKRTTLTETEAFPLPSHELLSDRKHEIPFQAPRNAPGLRNSRAMLKLQSQLFNVPGNFNFFLAE